MKKFEQLFHGTFENHLKYIAENGLNSGLSSMNSEFHTVYLTDSLNVSFNHQLHENKSLQNFIVLAVDIEHLNKDSLYSDDDILKDALEDMDEEEWKHYGMPETYYDLHWEQSLAICHQVRYGEIIVPEHLKVCEIKNSILEKMTPLKIYLKKALRPNVVKLQKESMEKLLKL
jgi:hypothetical protein